VSTKANKPKTPEQVLSVFAFHGVPVAPKTQAIANEHVVTDCLFCGKPEHFYVRVEGESDNGSPGSWDCKRCGRKGNTYTFLHTLYKHCSSLTKTAQYTALREHRNGRTSGAPGIPSSAYEELAWNPFTNRWLIPITNAEGSITNLLSYDPEAEKPFACPTPNLNLHAYNSRILGDNHRDHWDEIIVCEGVWDALALQWLLSRVPTSRDAKEYGVIGLCGAANTPDSLLSSLIGKPVTFFFDNDDAGNEGLKKALDGLRKVGHGEAIRAVSWPENYTQGYDVADHIASTNNKAHLVWRELYDMTEPVATATATASVTTPPLKALNRTSFAAVQGDFTKTGVEMSDKMRDGLAIACATVLSKEIPGDPLWVFLIGPSGSGKSLVLETLTEVTDHVEYETSMTSRSFLSGYSCGDEDPSLLARITDPPKCLVVKDYTTVLTLPPEELKTLYGIMRDAYDGRIERTFGNNVTRSYTGCFSTVAGVTPEIHTLSHSHLGERFLKFELAGKTNLASDKTVLAALRSGMDAQADRDGKRHRQAAVKGYITHLLNTFDGTVPALPEKCLSRLIALAKVVAMCRSVVSRDTHGVARYEGSTESPTRVAKQLAKLAQSLSLVFGEEGVGNRSLDICAKVAWDTSYGPKRDTLQALSEAEDGLTVEELAAVLDIPQTPAYRTLRDLRDLSLATRRKVSRAKNKRGQPMFKYSLSTVVEEIFNTADLPD
jgi:energy-coupling factor transporter ATP-binding protein EcfA2